MILKHLSDYTKYENKPQQIRAVGAIPGHDFSSIHKDSRCYSGSDEHCEKWLDSMYICCRDNMISWNFGERVKGNQRYHHDFGG